MVFMFYKRADHQVEESEAEELLWLGDHVDVRDEILKPPEDAETFYREECSTED